MADTLLSPALLIALLRNNGRRLVIAWGIVFLCIAAAIVLMRPMYSGTTIVLVDPRQQRVLQSDAVLSGIGNDMGAVDSQIEVIQSSAIARKVIADLKLEDEAEFAPPTGVGSLLRSLFGKEPDAKMQYALRQFATNLKVRRRGATYVLEIEYRSPSATRAAQIANAVATTYVEQQSTSRSSATSEASNFLAERLTTLRKQSSDADAAVARYREQNGLINSGERRSVVEQQLADTNQQLIAARVRSEDVKARLRQVDKAASDPAARQSLIETLQSPVIAALRAQYAVAFKSGAELAQSLGPRHPALKNSEAEQAAITRQIDAEIRRIMLGVKGEYEAAESRQKSLEADLARLKAATSTNDLATVRLNELEREAEAARAILQRSLARYKETREQEGMQAAEARIISPAIAPVSANGPSRTLLLAAALLASALLALLFVAATDRSTMPAPASAPDPAPPHTPEPPPAPEPHRQTAAVRERVTLPALGYVPHMGGTASARHDATAGWSLTSPFSPFQEAVRRMASDFMASAQRPQILALCGATPGAGASVIARGFADALARSGQARVLRFDASHVLSDVAQRRVGLAQTAKGGLPPEFAIDKASNGAADVLHLGIADQAQFLDLADRHVILDALTYLRASYDAIVIDTGSAVSETQSQRLIALADAAALVSADAATLERPDVVQAVAARRSKFIGMIANRSDLDIYRTARVQAAEGGPGQRSDAAPMTARRAG